MYSDRVLGATLEQDGITSQLMDLYRQFTGYWSGLKDRIEDLFALDTVLPDLAARWDAVYQRAVATGDQALAEVASAGRSRTESMLAAWPPIRDKITQYLPTWRGIEEYLASWGLGQILTLLLNPTVFIAVIAALAWVWTHGIDLLNNVVSTRAQLAKAELAISAVKQKTLTPQEAIDLGITRATAGEWLAGFPTWALVAGGAFVAMFLFGGGGGRRR